MSNLLENIEYLGERAKCSPISIMFRSDVFSNHKIEYFGAHFYKWTLISILIINENDIHIDLHDSKVIDEDDFINKSILNCLLLPIEADLIPHRTYK